MFEDSFYCDQHREETDVVISGDFAIRRVRVTCDVLLAGVDAQAGVCQAEAVARLEAAVDAAGGVLDVSKVISTIGRYAGYVAAPDARPVPGRHL